MELPYKITIHWWLGALLALLALGAGCSDGGSCPETACGRGERCVDGECEPLVSLVCIPECDPGQTCSQGSCVAVDDACMRAGQLCDASQPRSNGFFCVDWDGANFADPATCEAPCDVDATCGAGSACFLLSYGAPQSCFSQQDCASGELCQSGVCRPAACKRSECEGMWDGQLTCEGRYGGLPQFARGAACVELPNEVNFCFPAGGRQLDQSCISAADAAYANSFEQACAPGLGCVQGSCKTACREDAHCSDGLTCLFAAEDKVARGVGFCGQPCVPFSTGTCGAEQKCLPLDAERGFCVPAGVLRAGDACAPGQWQCEEGTICTDYAPLGGDGGARCLPMCNIHVASGDADIPRVDQARRDATCPQVEPPARASLDLLHLAPLLGAADIYLDDELLVAGLSAGQREPASGWRTIDTGTHRLAARRAGADPQDAPLVERVFSVRRDAGQRVALLDAASGARLDPLLAEAGGGVITRSLIAQGIFDAPRAEIIALDAAGQELGRLGVVEPGQAVEADLAGATSLALAAPGAPAADAFARLDLAAASGAQVIALMGTLNPDDGAALEARSWTRDAPALALADALSWTCTSIGNEGYGVCEQRCDEAADLSGKCQGDLLGCQPVTRNAVIGAEAICRPVMQGGVEGAPCDPFSATGACGAGFSCVRFGPGSSSIPGPAGRCVPQCVVDGEPGCADGRLCLASAPELFLGRCEWPCSPGGSYADTVSCPDGLQTCEPRTQLDESSQSGPMIVDAPSICSESGAIPLGQSCSGGDCAPGAECLYPRSRQLGLSSGLLSPYLGGAGTPTCRAQCDPFDARRSATVCALGETCLPNYPWSADVGHCAPIVETAGSFQPCQRPGESCGEDSVCVTDGASPFCLRLCEYTGQDSAQGTCDSGEQCIGLVSDIGYCQARGG